MIKPPRRAVTRFFIPLIDVLILLFCIFLLMPFVEKGAASGRLTPGEAQALRERIAQLEQYVNDLERTRPTPDTIQRLEQELADVKSRRAADRVMEEVLYYDRDRNELYRMEDTGTGKPRRSPIRSREEAQEIVKSDRTKDPTKDLIYVVLYPPGRPPRNQWQDDVQTKWFGSDAQLRWRELAEVKGGGS
jgi:hypothetical protein